MSTFYHKSTNRYLKKAEPMEASVSTFLVENNRVYAVKLDMNKVDYLKTDFKFKQYDYGTCFISAQILDGEVPIDIANKTIVATFRNDKGDIIVDKNDKPISSIAKVIIESSGVVNIGIPRDVLKGVGNIDCEIILFDSNGSRMTSPMFLFYIEKSMFDHESLLPPTPTESPICGEVLCGEAICGDEKENKLTYEISSFVSEEFINKFGGR